MLRPIIRQMPNGEWFNGPRDPYEEHIIKAAILLDYPYKYERLFYLSRPSRHHHIHLVWKIGLAQQVQGFVTSYLHRFVDRKEALKIAIQSGQIEKGFFQKNELFSEDLW